MFTSINIWVLKKRLERALRNEKKARARMFIERLNMAQIEETLARAELTALTNDFYKSALQKTTSNTQ